MSRHLVFPFTFLCYLCSFMASAAIGLMVLYWIDPRMAAHVVELANREYKSFLSLFR